MKETFIIVITILTSISWFSQCDDIDKLELGGTYYMPSGLKDKSLADLDNLPDPDVLANEIIENIEAGLKNFREIMDVINGNGE